MSRLRIRHETLYTYARPIGFGPWKLLMRPLDTHAIRLVEASLELSAAGPVRWTYDAYGNSICIFTPRGPSDRLRVVNHLLIDRYPAPLAVDNPQSALPLVYDVADRAVLDPFIAPATADRDADYLDWLRDRMGPADEPALDFLQRLNSAIHVGFTYGTRDEQGTQSPSQTIQRGQGTCRDFAWLMIESLRRLGFAARFATGYLYSPRIAASGIRGAGATHAWCEVFLPDLGWIEFDPTNGLAESEHLIRVATTRTPAEASIMNGMVTEQAECNLKVAVDVDLVGPDGLNVAA
ncbi:MAG: transglutaminase [Caulobacter sp. 12-67-6]|nr:MAG: transglutaminase [Caulobacter sp. 12-67-6]OYX35326.1 MAG: transglutaminase [Caulobacterales bacterium 32-69-10]